MVDKVIKIVDQLFPVLVLIGFTDDITVFFKYNSFHYFPEKNLIRFNHFFMENEDLYRNPFAKACTCG